jgi:hypothetical protein
MFDDVLGKGVRPEKDTIWGGDEAAFGQGAPAATPLRRRGETRAASQQLG